MTYLASVLKFELSDPGSFVLSPDFARPISQDGGSTIESDGATISTQNIQGLFTVYKTIYVFNFLMRFL